MLNIDLSGRRALVAGVADDGGFGFAIAKSLAEAGATVCVGTWPPALNIFLNLIERGKMDESRKMEDGSLLSFERIYPLDAAFDSLTDAPDELRAGKRYKDVGDFSIDGLTARLMRRFRPETARHSRALARERPRGQATPARDHPCRLPGGCGRQRLFARQHGEASRATHAAPRVVPLPHVHGGGARNPRVRRRHVICQGRARERYAHARVRGRKALRRQGQHHQCRALRIARCQRHRNHRRDGGLLRGQCGPPGGADRVRGRETAAFLASRLASGITGTTLYVDKGYHAMGMAVDRGTPGTI